MPWITNVKFEVKDTRGKIIKNEFDHSSEKSFPDLVGDTDRLLRILERESGLIIHEILELETKGKRIDFKQELKLKGWKMKDLAFRWGITQRQVSNIAKMPKLRDWDAIDGLPEYDDCAL